MLEQVDMSRRVDKEAVKPRIKELEKKLAFLQQQVRQKKIPVVLVFEGWGASGKGSMIGKLILELDPRGFQVYCMGEPTQEEKRLPFLNRYWLDMPARGECSIFDRSWYQELSVWKIEKKYSEQEVAEKREAINRMERQLTDDGCLLLKFFLHITKKQQRMRFEALSASKNTAWRVTERDWKHNREYATYYRAWDDMLEQTDTPYAPWHIIAATDKQAALLDILEILVDALEQRIAQQEQMRFPGILPEEMHFPMRQIPKLKEITMLEGIEEEEYRKRLKQDQKKLRKLANKLYRKKIPLIICYEGWDAAGKGGNIRRMAASFDPRGYDVTPIAAPDHMEISHHYLWRFRRHLPKTGHVAIFDRTWYGRVMVERVEGFATPEQWKRAYNEMNEFEQELSDWGAILVKFWLHIDKEEQLKRFEERQNTPEKQWKITEEDWRNREKWEQYEIAVDEMMQNTSTSFAPWHIIATNDKYRARVEAIERVIAAIEQRLT